MFSTVSLIPLGAYGQIRVEIAATTRLGPFRLIVDHPSTRITEYFVTLDEALSRRAQLETILNPAVGAIKTGVEA